MVNMSADDQSPISSFHGAEMLIFYKLKDRRVERIDIASIDRGAFVDLLARTPDFLVGTESVPGFRDLGIDVSEEALYRVFSSDGHVRRQFLRHGRDTLSLAGCLSKTLVHGSRDNVRVDGSLPPGSFAAKDFKLLANTLAAREIEVRCGTAARLMSYIGLLKGLPSRVLHFKSPAASIGTAHVMTEIYIPDVKRSVLFDVDFGCVFLFGGKALSYYDSYRLLKNSKELQIHFFNDKKKYAMDGFYNDYIYNTLVGARQFLTEALLSDSVSTALWHDLDGEAVLQPTETRRDWTP